MLLRILGFFSRLPGEALNAFGDGAIPGTATFKKHPSRIRHQRWNKQETGAGHDLGKRL